MKPAEAQEQLNTLRSAYPMTKFGEDSIRLYLRTLQSMNAELGRRAIVSAIENCGFMPAIADLHHHYGIVREQRMRENRDEQQRLERLAEDNLPHVDLAEIPAAQEHLSKIRSGDSTAVFNLEKVKGGKCDDCSNEGPRFAFFKLALCSGCITSRLRVKAQVEAA